MTINKKNLLNRLNEENKYFINEYEVDLNNLNNSHSLICRNVEKNSKVLDVGCGSGIIGKCLFEKLSCEVDGIDLDKEALDVSEKLNVYKELYNYNVDNYQEYEKLLKTKKEYDYIIFADLLEHTYDPINIILKFAKMLKKNGKILISIPNIGHLDIIGGLINGEFNYDMNGILDNTHLRFFTNNSFCQYIKNSNFANEQKFDCRLIGKTQKSSDYQSLYPDFNELFRENENVLTFQWIFELNLIKKIEEAYNLEKEIKDKQTKYLIKFDNNLRRRNTQIKNQSEIIRNNTKKIEELEQRLSSMINSRSWKITKPLRKITGLLKNK